MNQFSRALFLDFDGVLHPSGGPPGHSLPFCWVDTLAEDLIEFPEVALAVHSTWVERFSASEIQDFLTPLSDRFIGTVDVGVGVGVKADAIISFTRARPGILNWLVIDDDAGEFPDQFPVPVLLCDPLTGIEAPAARRLLRKWLTSGWSTSRSTMEPP